MTAAGPITLLELNSRLSAAIAAAPGLRDVWVCAETSDVRVAGGHCYLELIQKDPDSGAQLARARATIWRSAYGRLAAGFRAVTGCDFASGIKVLVRVAVSYHPVYGLSLNIDAIDPEYTLGDLLRRRREMIARLTAEGIIDCNRSLKFGALLSYAAEHGFDCVATGHYARIQYDAASGRYLLRRALDASKDQSYVLYMLTQAQLARLRFPLGDHTKAEAREMAAAAGAGKPLGEF